MQNSNYNVLKILDAKQLKKTQSRIAVLSQFATTKTALSHKDVEDNLGELFDRVTIYRILKTFEEHGIIHVIPTEGSNKYALSKSESENKQHLHFFCNSCKEVVCLHGVNINSISIPSNFSLESLVINASGICGKCQP
ncbi:MAG: Fur family transcriptional regulator [Luteibaculaceae bacterium]